MIHGPEQSVFNKGIHHAGSPLFLGFNVNDHGGHKAPDSEDPTNKNQGPSAKYLALIGKAYLKRCSDMGLSKHPEYTVEAFFKYTKTQRNI